MPDEDQDRSAIGGNCPDSVKREFWREALQARIGLESAQEVTRRKNGEYRAVLMRAKKAGVSTDSLTHALTVRFMDPDEVLREEREKIKMLALSGFLPGIMEQLIDRTNIEEPTFNEQHETNLIIARDRGQHVGIKGGLRDDNPYPAGTEYHVNWVEGYLAGQRAIADEMGENAAGEVRVGDMASILGSNESIEHDAMEVHSIFDGEEESLDGGAELVE